MGCSWPLLAVPPQPVNSVKLMLGKLRSQSITLAKQSFSFHPGLLFGVPWLL